MARGHDVLRECRLRHLSSVRAGRLDLSMSDEDEPHEVTARTVRDAQAVEALLRPLAHLCIDPPQGRNCLSPKAHPALWSDAG